ncbi:MAG: aromatic-ring-hydroxylating dioxygenase subunit beta [Rhodospirillaceae bacterium]|nr:aromatic-ring-hydroxylating dioxygenase subunit beta [Rhodospirillaceae bacterium]
MLTVAAPAPLAAPGPHSPAAADAPLALQRTVEQFLYRQAELLDTRQWQGFIDLFAPGGVYWMPAHPHQTTGDGEPSIFYEDRHLMTIRMKRILHPHAWSQKTEWGTSHLVSNVVIESHDAQSVVCRSRFHLLEFRRDASRHFAGSYVHRLTRNGEGFRIALQRVDMVNGEGLYEYVLQAWV